jgi:hypothetical protein
MTGAGVQAGEPVQEKKDLCTGTCREEVNAIGATKGKGRCGQERGTEYTLGV